jgi:AcrR family transcriptional regulator
MVADNPSSTDNHDSPFNRSAQHDAKRLAILSQAARLFNYKGSRATTLRDIAEVLGLTKTSLYYYVKTKEELIYQCYMAALDFHLGKLDDIELQHAAPLERLSAFMLQHFDNWLAAQEGRGPHIAALLEIASLKGDHRRQVEARYIALFKRILGYLREGIADGSMRKIEPIATTRAVIGSIDWAFSWLHKIPQEEVGAAAERALDIITHGLYAGEGEYTPATISLHDNAGELLQGFNREQQKKLKQEAFYKTGTWFFNKQGFNGTSLDEIAEHLNVSKGAFYYHIKNKEDLLFNCYSRSLDLSEKIHQQAASSPGTGLDKVEQTCRRFFYFQNSSEGPLIRYSSITALPMERRRDILQRTDATNQRFGDFIREGIADGSVRPIDTFVAQELIAGAVNASMDLSLWRQVDDLNATAVDYFDIFFNGLLPRT